MLESILIATCTAITVGVFSFYRHKNISNEIYKKFQVQLEKANEAEKQTHLRELELLAERKDQTIKHATELEQLRQRSFEEGRKRGIDESQLDIAIRLAKQSEDFAIQLKKEKEVAAREAKELQRTEYEIQAKLFSVKISPFVQLITDKGFVYDDYETKVGYQYQLLINGIPAFQPHVVVEQHEKSKEFDQAIKKSLLNIAQGCAQAALATYLGANPQFANIAPPILETVNK